MPFSGIESSLARFIFAMCTKFNNFFLDYSHAHWHWNRPQHLLFISLILYTCASWRYINLIVMALQLVFWLWSRGNFQMVPLVLGSMCWPLPVGSESLWSFYWCHLTSAIESLCHGANPKIKRKKKRMKTLPFALGHKIQPPPPFVKPWPAVLKTLPFKVKVFSAGCSNWKYNN